MDNGQQKKASTVTSQKDNISNSNSRSYTDGCSTVSQPPPPKNLLLTRGFSRVQANEDILAETRNRIESNLVSSIKEPVSNSNNNSASSSVHILNELAYFSFALPNLNRYDDDYKFKEYLQNDLIDLPTLCSLSESGHLNWWQQGVWEDVNRPLYPMVTSGDGNCLLHAASLSMWGLHDRHLALRKALHSTLENIPESNDSPLWRRWKWEQASQNRRYGLILSDEEWSREWRSLLKLSSFQPRANCVEAASSRSSDSSSNKDATTTVYFESLEEFHVFLLAHILQRPIIIVSDTMLHDADGEPLSPIPFGGIYLPLECDVGACYRYPLVLAYDSAHFSALVLMDADNDHEEAIENCTRIDEINRRLQTKWPYAVIPITYSNGELLPVHFGYDPGKDYDWSRFPDTRPPELIEQEETQNNKNQKNNNTNMIDASNNNNNNTSNNEGAAIELSRDERMFLIQRYLDIVKLELYDPGPAATVKRTANVATNSSGMRVNIVNINVPPPIYHFPVQRNEPNRSSKSFRQKFLNMFKKTDRNNEVEFNSDSKLRKSVNSSTKSSTSIIKNLTGSSSSNKNSIPQAISYSKIDPSNSMPTPLFSTAKPIFHKQTTYKSWSSLFDSMNNHICMLGVKLNLARLPKHSQMICNYIDNAKIKYDMLQQQQLQQQQQQQQKTSISNPNTATTSPQKYLSQSSSYVTAPSAPQAPQEHYCVANRPDCHPNDPCGQCKLSMNNSESSLRSINVNTRGGSINHHQQSMGHNKSNSNVSHNSFSYNQANNNRTANGAVLNSNKGRVVPTNTSNVSTGYYTRPL